MELKTENPVSKLTGENTKKVWLTPQLVSLSGNKTEGKTSPGAEFSTTTGS